MSVVVLKVEEVKNQQELLTNLSLSILDTFYSLLTTHYLKSFSAIPVDSEFIFLVLPR